MITPWQFQWFQTTYLFKIRIGLALFWGIFFSLFCALGVWQFHRYEYKKNLLAVYQQRVVGPPQSFQGNEPEFQLIKVTGHYLNQYTVLLQNRFYHGQLGWEVLTPFKVAHHSALLLIDRGWISRERAKQKNFFQVFPERGSETVIGQVKLLNEYQFILGKNILRPEVFPLVMQKIEIKKLSEVTHQLFYPFIVRLSASEPHGFVRDWVITTILPERHLAYAVQWFAMAAVLLIAYLSFCCERVIKNDKK